uniref:C2 domain-containing protein n=1 Tax=Echinococcus granulosus TaxID=6210 RepID=A0A068WUE9_ECHGR|nr:hypothetical protein EgrG_000055300 [Echinococcus granulosus]
MPNSVTSVIFVICITLAAIAVFICAATLAVSSPWWPQRKRTRHGHASNKITSSVIFLRRVIETFSLTSPKTSSRTPDTSRRSSIFAGIQSLPLRSHSEKFYGATNPHHAPTRPSISSYQTSSVGESLQVESAVKTIGGFLAPPTKRPRSGSTSLLHDLAKGSYDGLSPIPALISTVNAQPDAVQADPASIQPIKGKVDSATVERRKSLRAARRITLGSLSPKLIKNEMGASLSELISILDTQVSRSTHTSPSRKRTHSLTVATPIVTPPPSQISPIPRFTAAEAPGGTINYRVFIDATGRNNLTVRVHLYYATNLPAIKPWKNSNYIVKAALIGFKSHFVQTSGVVTAACGSPRFSEGHPSVLDFVLDCGMPYNKSEEEVQLRLMVIEFSGRKPGEKALLVATKEYRFNHHTLRGKSTLSIDVSWERCKPCIDVYQLNADVLASLIQREKEGYLRFEIHEIRNPHFRQLLENPVEMDFLKKKTSLYPIKLRLRACLVANGKAICVRKGFNIRLPAEFADRVVNGDSSAALVLKHHVFSSSELVLNFRPPFPGGLDKPEVFTKVGVRLVQWRILAYFVLILEDTSSNPTGSKRVRAIGSCCLGSNAQNATTMKKASILNDGILPLLSTVASESSQPQVSQWLHIE